MPVLIFLSMWISLARGFAWQSTLPRWPTRVLFALCAGTMLCCGGALRAEDVQADVSAPAAAGVAGARMLVGASLLVWSLAVPERVGGAATDGWTVELPPGSPAAVDPVLSRASSILAYVTLASALGAGVGGSTTQTVETVSVTATVICAAYAARTYLKQLFVRPRPAVAGGEAAVQPDDLQSFPSGHALLTWACAGDAVVSWASGERPAWPAALLAGQAAVVSYLRWSSGEHYAGDVAAGALIGFGLGAVASLVAR